MSVRRWIGLLSDALLFTRLGGWCLSPPFQSLFEW
jgi:hypothetical protein